MMKTLRHSTMGISDAGGAHIYSQKVDLLQLLQSTCMTCDS